jgi:formylglycine-generating enzyme required for sulfatase activity
LPGGTGSFLPRAILINAQFPLGADASRARERRAQALVVLCELADDHGRRGSGLTKEKLAEAFGQQGDEVLEKLASSRMRLIVREEHGHSVVYALSHDRLAEVVTRFVDEETARGELDLDRRVVDLRRFVAQRSDLYVRSKDTSALDLTRRQYDGIRRSESALLQDDQRRRWWDASRARRSAWRLKWAAVSAAAIVALGVGGWFAYEFYGAQWHTEICGAPNFRADRWCLPDESLLGFVRIEAGPFLMGSDKSKDSQADEDEFWTEHGGQGSLTMDEYYIARYEVTVGQFKQFVEASQYKAERLSDPSGELDFPMSGVSWHDAVAYTRWLETQLKAVGPDDLRALLNKGWRVTLPSEAEWEKAARGLDGWIYPWGNDLPSAGLPRLANYESSTLRPVGAMSCPQCANELADMAGNVWEWTRSLRHAYPYVAGEGQENPKAGEETLRVVRGGAFDFPTGFVRAAARLSFYPDYRLDNIGFRVVVSPFFSGL